MNRRTAIRRLATIFLTTASLAAAQQPRKLPHIGYLVAGSRSSSQANVDIFHQGLRDLGYVGRTEHHA